MQTRVATLKETGSQTESGNSERAISEFGAVTIDFNPAPDAKDRLRRLFALLLNHVAREGEADASEGLPADAKAKDGAEQEPTASGAHGGDAL